MYILNNKKKKEIKDLINIIESKSIYLTRLEIMRNFLWEINPVRVRVDIGNFLTSCEAREWAHMEVDCTNKRCKTELILRNAKKRLKELGVY